MPAHAQTHAPPLSTPAAPPPPPAPPTNNVVPYQWNGYQRSGPHAYGTNIPIDFRDVDDADLRPILLFDLNGTITSHTAKRRSSGINKPRPGVHHLRLLLV